jgi:N-methylhydantoinase A
VDVRNDYVQTAVARHAVLDHATVQSTFDRLTARAAAALDAEGFPREAHRYERSVDLRYLGQAFEVRVPAPEGAVDRAHADAVADAFHAEHHRLYGYDFRDDPRQQVEWVNLRVTGIQPLERPALRRLDRPLVGGIDRALSGTRSVWFDDAWRDTPLYAREKLQPGDCVPGPAIIEEFGSTTVVLPRLHASVDDFGNLLLAPTV